MRTAQLPLPNTVDGLTLQIPGEGSFVVVNKEGRHVRRRFSFAHEYAHVLFESQVPATVTHAERQEDPREKRANAFAAAFLLPERGVRDFLVSLGKGPRRSSSEVMEGSQVYSVRNTQPARLDGIQPHDVMQVSHYIGAGHEAVLYRLGNLGYLSSADRERLWRAKGDGTLKELHGQLLGTEEGNGSGSDEPERFHHRFLTLVLEALRREEINLARAHELVELIHIGSQQFIAIRHAAGLPDDPGEIVLPRGGE